MNVTAIDAWDVSYQSWESLDGQLHPITIRAFAARPSGSAVKPGVVLAHGLGGYATESQANNLAAQLGTLVIAYSGPGSGNAANNTSEGLGPNANNGYRMFDTVQDVRGSWFWGHAVAAMRAVTCMQTRSDVDGSKIGITGFSAGGAISHMAAGADDRIKVAVPESGVGAWNVATQSPTAWQWSLLQQSMLTTSSPEWIILENKIDPAVLVAGTQAKVLEVDGTTDEFFPLTPVLQVSAAGGGSVALAAVDPRGSNLTVEKVSIWASTDDCFVWVYVDLDRNNSTTYSKSLPAVAPNASYYVDVQYKTNDLVNPVRFSLSSPPVIPAGLVPRIRAINTCL